MYEKKILITGGAGFIGSHTVRHFVNRYPQYKIVNADKLTYAGNLANLKDTETNPNYEFVRGDITDLPFLVGLFKRYDFDGVIHLAAESHVDRSIASPFDFVMTNVVGTVYLLECFRETCAGQMKGKLFYHVSTDEVYGSLGREGLFTEDTPYDPRSPYSASKAGSDHFVRSFGHTYQMPVVISNCSNNYGPFQFPEKLIPLVINNIRENRPIPVYGKGENIRDWIYVEDHVSAIDRIFHSGRTGETYNIGGDNEWKNIDLVRLICRLADESLHRPRHESESLITLVRDRAGHDLRYAMDSSKLKRELEWAPSTAFEEGSRKTIKWYLGNEQWLREVTSGEYRKYYEKQYREEKQQT